MELDDLTIGEWVTIYESLDEEGHLTETGRVELNSMKELGVKQK